MSREEFISLVNELGLPYKEGNIQSIRNKNDDRIYVYSKKEYELAMKHPKKVKYIPYIRVSDFGDMMYIRDNGWCEYTNDNDLKERLKQLAGLEES